MHIHEYQAKNLLRKYGISVPSFFVASRAEEVIQGNKELALQEGVIKIQIHAGGRGKAGGVKFGKNPEEILRLSQELLGRKFVTNQTGPQGALVEKVLISAPVNIQKEYYLSIIIDRKEAAIFLLASPEGGMDIEEIARDKPDRLLKLPVSFSGKMHSYHLIELANFMGWEKEVRTQGMDLVKKLCQAFVENDASLIEINPLVLTKEGRITALDAKFTVDDNALFRQPALRQWYDPSQQTVQEVMAREFHLSYIGLEGSIGCLVNGAGLAMATMDTINFYGGKAANFLDIGGSATQEEISHGFKILLNDPQVRAIFVNIFGGIMDCGLLAQGMLGAIRQISLQVPLIVRMEGTNVEIGRKTLRESGIKITLAETMAEGAKAAVQAVAKGE